MPTILQKNGKHRFVLPEDIKKERLVELVRDLIYCKSDEADYFGAHVWLRERVEYYKLNPETGKPKRHRRSKEEIEAEALKKRDKRIAKEASRAKKKK